ncbi:hypothetical protein K402DRAFT_230516 [Aulographum hederae CBS 113979]|uniref:Uncharacterized protein n=1 Tax=Aulographum hederae CBS 113979 TaxID=1176131 RepID=A0A6G1HBV8_9PEZI|nr:hypothetical protein K402DRAFT_230516 [Aulographum hederae CBS 113979]
MIYLLFVPHSLIKHILHRMSFSIICLPIGSKIYVVLFFLLFSTYPPTQRSRNYSQGPGSDQPHQRGAPSRPYLEPFPVPLRCPWI